MSICWDNAEQEKATTQGNEIDPRRMLLDDVIEGNDIEMRMPAPTESPKPAGKVSVIVRDTAEAKESRTEDRGGREEACGDGGSGQRQNIEGQRNKLRGG